MIFHQENLEKKIDKSMRNTLKPDINVSEDNRKSRGEGVSRFQSFCKI
jgi:hypothetical protein